MEFSILPLKALRSYHDEFLAALSYAQVYGITLSLAQFSAARKLDLEEFEALRQYCVEKGVI